MPFVKSLPLYQVDKEVYLSSIRPGSEFLLKINGDYCVYQMCKIGNTPLTVNCPEGQPNKHMLIVNLSTGRLVNKHPSQRVIPVVTKMGVKLVKTEVAGSN